MKNESFDKLSSKFGTSFEEEVDKVNKDIEKVEERKNELVKKVHNTEIAVTFEDQKYLLDESKNLIRQTNNVLDKLEEDIKVGSPARMYEVFGSLSNAKTNQLRELRELCKMVMEMKVFGNDLPGADTSDEKISMTGADMLKLIRAAKQESELNNIDADFKIIEEGQE